jgi:hypothetical protein
VVLTFANPGHSGEHRVVNLSIRTRILLPLLLIAFNHKQRESEEAWWNCISFCLDTLLSYVYSDFDSISEVCVGCVVGQW